MWNMQDADVVKFTILKFPAFLPIACSVVYSFAKTYAIQDCFFIEK